jgi:hypothetical protein
MIKFALQCPPRFPRKVTGGRAPSINIGAGRSSLECSTEMVSSECMRQVRPRAVSLAPL